jgi:hypothetical protein
MPDAKKRVRVIVTTATAACSARRERMFCGQRRA